LFTLSLAFPIRLSGYLRNNPKIDRELFDLVTGHPALKSQKVTFIHPDLGNLTGAIVIDEI